MQPTDKTLQVRLKKFQRHIGIRFRNQHLLQKALTHRSYKHEVADPVMKDNERYEFFGDSILSFIVSKRLLRDLPQADEGTLSNLRSNLVSKKALFRVARKLSLKKYLLLGKGERKGLVKEKTRILGNSVEAIIAAIYLDRGIKVAEEFIMKYFGEFFSMRKLARLHVNYKSQLQEWAQRHHKLLPLYKTTAVTEGFVAEVEVPHIGKASGLGSSKREAEQMAAKNLIKFLKEAKAFKLSD